MKPIIFAVLFSAFLPCAAQAADKEAFIGGSTPSVRPAGAPKITVLNRDQAWFAKALTGVSEPYPKSLWFLENQGAWHTPFTHPGMTGPYDIRGWHGK